MLIMSLLVVAGVFVHLFESAADEIRDRKRRRALRKADRKKRQSLQQC